MALQATKGDENPRGAHRRQVWSSDEFSTVRHGGHSVKCKVILAQLLTLSVSGALMAQAPPAKVTLEDLLSAEGGGRGGRGGLTLTPDGKYFAGARGGQIVLTPVNGGPAVPFTSAPGQKSELSWSRDGKKLAYVSQGAIWVVAAGSSEARQLSEGKAGPGDPRGATDHAPHWNPNGKWILYESGRHGQNELYVVSEDGRTTNLLAATEIYEGTDHLGSPGGQGDDAVSSDRFDAAPAWSPDGTRIKYTERSRQFFSGKLKVLAFDASTGRATGTTTLYTAKNDRGGAWAVNTAVWSPDSKTLAVVLQESGWDKVYLLHAAGGKPKPLTRGESEDETPVYSPDGRFLAIVSNRDNPEERHIWIAPVDGGAPKRLTRLGTGVESGPVWSADGGTIYFSYGTPLRPATRYAAAVDGSAAPRPLDSSEAPGPSRFEQEGLTAPEVVHFKSKDGLTIAGILHRPLGFHAGTRYPAVIWAHGGPEGQDTVAYSAWPFFLAQEGYVVLQPNFRGSTGYGEKFRNLNVEDSGGGEIDDVGAAAKFLADQGLADPKRIAIGGGSHGGTVVANAVAKLPAVFAAGLELYGVVDRALFLQFTNRNSRIRWETKMGGTPEQKPAVYRKANILPDVGRIQTPLLIMHGEQDPQVPPQESQQLVAALKQAGKTFSYVTYPGEGHGFTQRDHRLDAWRKQLAFLQKYLGGQEDK
jgi:dipeptidyl aminopeptidase/acylaminoacyl peptidase